MVRYLIKQEIRLHGVVPG